MRIFDLAVDMIKSAGRRPFVDIDIAIVGVRPVEEAARRTPLPMGKLDFNGRRWRSGRDARSQSGP